MYILPQKEVKRLGGDPALDLMDIGSYFWTQMSVDDVERRSVGHNKCWRHHAESTFDYAVKRAMACVGDILCANRFPRPQDPSEWSPRTNVLEHFLPNGKPQKRLEYRQGIRLSTSLLMWPDELQKIGIEAEPGYLYLRVPPIESGRLGEYDYSSIEEELNPEFTYSWNPRKREATLALDRMPKGRLRDLEILFNCCEVTPAASIPEPKIVIAFGESVTHKPLADWAEEHCFRDHLLAYQESRRRDEEQKIVMGFRFKIPDYPRVVKTPLEFPPGYVADTASYLQSVRGFRDTEFAKSFYQFVYSGDTLERALRNAPKKGKEDKEIYPRGEPNLAGADLAWRYSENPWLVQMVLFARLIGGRYLTQVLGSLALGYGKERGNWNSALFSAEKQSPRIARRTA